MTAVEVASLFATLSLQDNMTGALRNARSALDGFGGQMQNAGRRLQGFGASMTLATAPLAAFGAAGIAAASDFESALAEIQARSGATAEDMALVSDFALQMGADTAFSSQQAADALLELMSSGQSVSEAMATLPMVMDAAAAGGEDLATTADNLTNIMASFGLEIDRLPPALRDTAEGLGITSGELNAFARGGDPGDTIEGISSEFFVLAESLDMTVQELYTFLQTGEDASTVVESLARAAGASSADMASLGEGFANVGPVAAQFGMSVDQTAAALAILAENGIAGAEAGTALKSMLLNMSHDTEAVQGAWNELGISMYDSEGNMRNMQAVLYELDAALSGLPAEEQTRLMQDLAGSYGIVALAALTGDVSIGEMQTAMNEQASAAEVAAARMDTFKGRVDSLMGSFETLMITVMTPFMENVLTPLAEQLTGVINQFTAWADENPELAATIVAIGAGLVVLGPLLIGAGMAISAIGTAAAAAGTALAILTAPVVLLAGAFVGIMAAGGTLDDFLRDIGDLAGQACEGFVELADGIDFLLHGDTREGLFQIGVGIERIKNAVIGAPIALIENLAGAILELSGIGDLAGLQAWGPALEMAAFAVEVAFDRIKRGIEDFFFDAEAEFLGGVARIQQNLGLEIDPNIQIRLEQNARTQMLRSIGEQVQTALAEDMASGDLGPTLFIPINGANVNILDPAAHFDIPALVDNLSVEGRAQVQSAINMAMGQGDQNAFYALLPLMVEMGFDRDDMIAQFQNAIDVATTVEFFATVGTNISVIANSVDISGITGAVNGALNAAIGAATAPNTGSLSNSVPSFHTGGQGHEGLAMLLDTERVLSPQETRDYNSGRGGGNTYVIHSYGQSPHELVNLIDQTRQDRG